MRRLSSFSGGRRPISGFSKFKAALDREVARTKQVAPWTLHDLRRTARTRLSGLGVLPLVAELTIGHKQSGVAAVYDLHTYDAEKRAALERWADALSAIVGIAPPPEDAAIVPAAAGVTIAAHASAVTTHARTTGTRAQPADGLYFKAAGLRGRGSARARRIARRT